jgi:hypothetical protein
MKPDRVAFVTHCFIRNSCMIYKKVSSYRSMVCLLSVLFKVALVLVEECVPTFFRHEAYSDFLRYYGFLNADNIVTHIHCVPERMVGFHLCI